MICPKCQHEKLEVIDTRPYDTTVRRRRRCLQCESSFTTYEVNLEEWEAIKYQNTQSYKLMKDTLLREAEKMVATQVELVLQRR